MVEKENFPDFDIRTKIVAKVREALIILGAPDLADILEEMPTHSDQHVYDNLTKWVDRKGVPK